MLMIRFMRIGRKNQPSFKIVVTEKTKSSTGGRFVEDVGFYNPITKEKVLKPERLKYWISQGAQPTPTVSNLLISEKVIEGEKIPKHKKSKKPAETPAAQSTAVPAQIPTPQPSPSASAEATANKEATASVAEQLIESEGSSEPERPKVEEPKPAEQPPQVSPEEGK